MDIYWLFFWVLLAICVVLYMYTRQVVNVVEDGNFLSFQKTYMVVYLLAMGGDWFQGPYVYALYQHYGMSSHQIDILFVAGFGSSMIFGTFVGSVADKFGRRFNCVLYGILYILSCITKHFPHFTILLVGRFLGGIATSILYSAFESWLICEHHKRGFNGDLLGILFSRATLGNSLTAISAGHIAQTFADRYGYVAPFDLSIVTLVMMIVAIMYTWNENYGDSQSTITVSFGKAAEAIKQDPKVLMLGLVQSLFEGAMYTFVLEWTPALSNPNSDKSIPHGLIFASFMVAVMIGSSVFKLLTKVRTIESFMRFVLLIAAMSLAVPVVLPDHTNVVFMAFCVFEMCVGIFWPSLGTMRGSYVPEQVRSTVMNFFRIPLNLIVIVLLIQNLKIKVVFTCCVCFLLLATVCQHILHRFASKLPKKEVSEAEDEKPMLEV
uniref:Molybdate-anion transporter n=1 Tax=Ciona intestinalis TaxID=7719 RepID=H2XRS8_CIOIN|nr:molybdate-anion transporter [Ciona intestinalis]|eukprot:XP_002129829.1 molybdate-anion transporter [Ciona intestinalis]